MLSLPNSIELRNPSPLHSPPMTNQMTPQPLSECCNKAILPSAEKCSACKRKLSRAEVKRAEEYSCCNEPIHKTLNYVREKFYGLPSQYDHACHRLDAYIRSLQQENAGLRGALIDLQQEHCDSHCGNGTHVTICQNASKVIFCRKS